MEGSGKVSRRKQPHNLDIQDCVERLRLIAGQKGRGLKMYSLDQNSEEDDSEPYEIETEDIKFKNMEDRQFLETLFERIPEAHKMILTMYYMQEMTYEEISQAAGLPMGSVKATLHRAKASLRKAALAELDV